MISRVPTLCIAQRPKGPKLFFLDEKLARTWVRSLHFILGMFGWSSCRGVGSLHFKLLSPKSSRDHLYNSTSHQPPSTLIHPPLETTKSPGPPKEWENVTIKLAPPTPSPLNHDVWRVGQLPRKSIEKHIGRTAQNNMWWLNPLKIGWGGPYPLTNSENKITCRRHKMKLVALAF